MEKQEVVARLPWLLNDSLESDERATVVAQLRAHEDLRDELAATRSAIELFGHHPSAEALFDWVYGEPGKDQASIQEHVAACRVCAEQAALVRASRAFEDMDVPTPDPSPAHNREAPHVPPELMANSSAVSPLWRWATMAACVLAVFCLTGWLGFLGGGDGPLAPAVTTTVASTTPAGPTASNLAVLGMPILTPDSQVFRSLTKEQAITLRPGFGIVVLQLTKPDHGRVDAWTVTVTNESGTMVWTEPVISAPSASGKRERYLPVAVPTDVFTPGKFEVALYAGPATGKPANRYQLRVGAAASP